MDTTLFPEISLSTHYPDLESATTGFIDPPTKFLQTSYRVYSGKQRFDYMGICVVR